MVNLAQNNLCFNRCVDKIIFGENKCQNAQFAAGTFGQAKWYLKKWKMKNRRCPKKLTRNIIISTDMVKKNLVVKDNYYIFV